MILFTSDKFRKQIGFMFGFTIFCIVFGAVYERFSHEVYSYYMIYAFVIPLIGSVLPMLAVGMKESKRLQPGTLKLWNLGIVTLTVGSLAKGALDIYGTSSPLLIVYPVCGALLCFPGIWPMGTELVGHFLKKDSHGRVY